MWTNNMEKVSANEINKNKKDLLPSKFKNYV